MSTVATNCIFVIIAIKTNRIKKRMLLLIDVTYAVLFDMHLYTKFDLTQPVLTADEASS